LAIQKSSTDLFEAATFRNRVNLGSQWNAPVLWWTPADNASSVCGSIWILNRAFLAGSSRPIHRSVSQIASNGDEDASSPAERSNFWSAAPRDNSTVDAVGSPFKAVTNPANCRFLTVAKNLRASRTKVRWSPYGLPLQMGTLLRKQVRIYQARKLRIVVPAARHDAHKGCSQRKSPAARRRRS
jgi:hypothetical protein